MKANHRSTKKVTDGFLIDAGELHQFRHIDAALAAFAFGKESMRPIHEHGHLTLGQVSLITSSNQPPQEGIVSILKGDVSCLP